MTDQLQHTMPTYEKIELLTSSRIFYDDKDTMHHFAAGTLLVVDPKLPKNTVKRRRTDVTPEDCEGFIESRLASKLIACGLAERLAQKPPGMTDKQ